ncbi:uncharacterized protein RB166_010832 [Leptodactylus fuscus]
MCGRNFPHKKTLEQQDRIELRETRAAGTVPSSKRTSPERCPSPLLLQDCKEENVLQDDQIDGDKLLYLGEDLNNINAPETYVRGKEEISTGDCPDDCTRSSEEHLISSDYKADDGGITQDTYEEHAITPDIPSALHSQDLSFLSSIHILSSNPSQTVTQEKIHKEVKPYSCSECGKCFTSKSDLVTHQRIHTGEKPYSCSECGNCFTSKSNLVTHHRIHTGEKPYSCSECGNCFTSKSNLVTHHRIHTGEKPYSCSECGKCFTRKSVLVEHYRSHAGEKQYSCSECGKCFITKSNLVTHQRIHTGEKPYSCSECGEYFRWKSNFVTHQRIHTRGKPLSCSEI